MTTKSGWAGQFEWPNLLFLTLTPLIGIGGTIWYVSTAGLHWMDLTLFVVFYWLTGMSIAVGYHRYFAHRTYSCGRVHVLLNLLFGAATFQNSALAWARDHRIHHKQVDTDRDPYNIKRGFLWAHIGWIFFKNDRDGDYRLVPDLTRDRLVMWQHNHYVAIAAAVGLLLPTLLGALVGRGLGGLLWGGVLRIVVVHHLTFFINSLAHMVGSQPYTDRETARDCWWVAVLTYGEGYHNFHHRFPSDYRNGHRWFHWDPAKWWIATMNRIGVVHRVVRHKDTHILRVRLDQDVRRIRQQLAHLPVPTSQLVETHLKDIRVKLEDAARRLQEARERYREARRSMVEDSRRMSERWRLEARRYELEFRSQMQDWLQTISSPSGLVAAAQMA